MRFSRDMFPTHPGILPAQKVIPAHDNGTHFPLGYMKGDEKKGSVSYRMGARFKVIATSRDRNISQS